MLLVPISSAQWNGYPSFYEYLNNEEKDTDQPVYWEQYYSDIEYNDDNADDDKYPRQLQETEPENSRNKRRQVI